MTGAEPDVETFFEVGCIAILDPNRRNERFRTIIRGWHKGSHMLLDRPRAPNGTFIALEPGLRCGLRFMRQGRACGFETLMLDFDKRQEMPYMRVAWPDRIEAVEVRRHARIDVELHCVIAHHTGAATTGTVVDLSSGGCGIKTTQPPEKDSVVAVDIELPDVWVRGVECRVRGLRKLDDTTWFCGCEYTDSHRAGRDEIEFFITTTMERLRAKAPSRPRLLLIDPDPESVAPLRAVIKDDELEVVVAVGVVDGMHRLRMSRPTVVVVNQGVAELPGIEICRILRRTAGLEGLKIFLHGEGPGLADQAAAYQVTLLPSLKRTSSEDLPNLAKAIQRAARMAKLRSSMGEAT